MNAEADRLFDAPAEQSQAADSIWQAVRANDTNVTTMISDFLLQPGFQLRLSGHEDITRSPHYNVGIDAPEIRNFAGIFSDRIFEVFHRFAKAKKNKPMLFSIC